MKMKDFFVLSALSAIVPTTAFGQDQGCGTPPECYAKAAAMLNNATKQIGPLQDEISRLKNAQSTLRSELSSLSDRVDALQRRPDVSNGLPLNSFDWVPGPDVHIGGLPPGGKWIAAPATCHDGYVATGGVCAGNPVNAVHPMTAFEGGKTFICNFYVVSTDLQDRTLKATASCLKKQPSN